MNSLPQDPIILLSYINTQLRDRYSSLSELCDDMQIDPATLQDKLMQVGYVYSEEQNRFL